MGQDTDLFHGLPTMGTLKSPGRYSPPGNGHPKQPQQQFPCTTQASSSAIMTRCRTPSIPLSPQRLETNLPGEVPRLSQSPVLDPDPSQGGDAGTAHQELALADQSLKLEYLPDLQHGIKNMWPTRPSESQEYDDSMLQRRTSDTAAGRSSSQPTHLSQVNSGYERFASQSRGSIDPQNMFQQPCPWKYTPPSTQPPLNQAVLYPSLLDVSVDESQASNNPLSYYSGMGNQKRYSDDVDFNLMSTAASYPGYTTSAEHVPITTSLSPSTSLSFYEAPPAMRQDREETVPLSDGDIEAEYKESGWWTEELLGGSPSSIEAPGSKVDEPYAQLIYRAFMSRPNKSMTLQEIYQWFREHTDKAKAEGKGWQNSIRHNLSMNGAFTKRNSKTPLNSNLDGSVSLDTTGVDGRKSTEWFLEPTFYAGVESTTRYRKGNSGSRSRAAANGHSGRSSRLGSDGHPTSGGGIFSHARVSAGRKGGNVAAQNRKRLADRQQRERQMEMMRPRPHPHHSQYMAGGGYGSAAGSMSYTVGGYGEADPYGYHHPHPAYSGQPPASLFSPVPGFGSGAARQQAELLGYNFFGSDDVGRDVHIKRSRTLGTENEHSEPTTPPRSAAEDPFGNTKHREFLPDMSGTGGVGGDGGSYNPLNSYQHGLGGMGGGHGGSPQQQQQQQAYSLADVTGIYDPPAGSHQPPVFMEQDLSLGSEDALLMDLSLMQ